MDRTPRLRSAFPSSPASIGKMNSSASPLKDETRRPGTGDSPVIPSEFVDAPSQRLYISLIYVILMSWRVYDFFSLKFSTGDSFLLFTKWVGIDTIFLYGLSNLRIPWLQWSSSTFTILFVAHGLLTWILMFQIPLPLFGWIGGLTKILYDREIAISERRVRPAAILHNSSLILGKQIINILPEGSAALNPDGAKFCIGGSFSAVTLPIQINESLPMSVELLRIDFDTNETEILAVPQKDLKRLRQAARRREGPTKDVAPFMLQYVAKRPGWYHLHRVVDDSKLEVPLSRASAAVVTCPTGFVGKVERHKCLRQLSDFEFVIEAVPPVQIRYSKIVNRDDQGHTTLTIHPDHLGPNAAMTPGVGPTLLEGADASWGQRQVLRVPMNESLESPGGWKYRLEFVRDAFGNVANYSEESSSEPGWYTRGSQPLEKSMLVHRKPQVAFKTCDSQKPVKVEEGKSTSLLIRSDTELESEESLAVSFKFTPMDDMGPDHMHSLSAEARTAQLRGDDLSVVVKDPGLYTITSVSSGFCNGEVVEPSSCIVINPPRPDLLLQAEEIADKCAGNAVGLLVRLQATGTPPFTLVYDVKKRGDRVQRKQIDFNQMQKPVELRPHDTGFYTYEFTEIIDGVYRSPISLRHKQLTTSVNVRAPASASFRESWKPRKACLGESASIDVDLYGEVPFELEYEIVHRGTRSRHKISNIQSNQVTIQTAPMGSGGEYIVALSMLIDSSGCKVPLETETALHVSLQRPRGAFGTVDGHRQVHEKEGTKVSLPIRFQGDGPWTVYYQRTDDPSAIGAPVIIHRSNDVLPVTLQGTYKLTSVHDRNCPGDVDEKSDTFTVHWLQRPEFAVADSPNMQRQADHFLRSEICEGDEDSATISFSGNPPFAYEYEQRLRLDRGPRSSTTKRFTSGLHTALITMESSEAGLYEYRLARLSDSSYGFETRKSKSTVIRQQVHARPSAQFTEGGKTYRYCRNDDTGKDTIPVSLTGRPPFQLELEVKTHASSKTDVIIVTDIDSNSHGLKLPQRLRKQGGFSMWIRKVQDARCQKLLERGGQQVHVQIAELPSISPAEDQLDYCIGDQISFVLQGSPPFSVIYTFENQERRAAVPDTNFRRLAEKPGEYTITSISDQRSRESCRAQTHLTKVIHPMPSVRVSKGRTSTIDIHEGGEAEILFEFGGTPPFHFTFTRSTVPSRGKASEVLETRNEISHEHMKTIRASAQGLYEVVAIRDQFCSFSKQDYQRGTSQRLLKDK